MAAPAPPRELPVPLSLAETEFELPGGVGLFDSGVGGLTVLEPLLRHQPRWPSVLLGDQAHVPYGGRPLAQIKGFALAQTDFLFRMGVEMVVMACNISSATALGEARRRYGASRVHGVIEPGCALALERTRHGRVAVLATEGTVRSDAYARHLTELDPAVQCRSIACPEFVPLIEAGHLDDAEARRAVAPYVEALREHRTDVAILGCTHYPHLLPALRAVGPEIDFVDPADGIVDAARGVSMHEAEAPVAPLLLTTGPLAAWSEQVQRMVRGGPTPVLGRAHWAEEASDVDPGPPLAVG